MWKKALVGAAALAVAGSSLVYAQQQSGGPDRPRSMFQRWQPSADDIAAFTDAGVAAMRAGLKLTPDQERNWPAFEAAARDIVKLRAERRAAMRDPQRQRPGNIVEFLQRRADAMSRGAAALKQLSDATSPLYQSLDEAQKRRFGILARMLRPRPQMAWMQRRDFGRGGSNGMRPGGDFGPRFNRGFDRQRFGEGEFRSDPFGAPRAPDRARADHDDDEPNEL